MSNSPIRRFSLHAQDEQPNVVLIFMDNFGWGELGVYGGGILRGAPTPRLDRLAAEGTGELYVNGEEVDEAEMPQMHTSTFSLAETFDVGRETGTQLSKLYSDPFPFVGALDKLNITFDRLVLSPFSIVLFGWRKRLWSNITQRRPAASCPIKSSAISTPAIPRMGASPKSTVRCLAN